MLALEIDNLYKIYKNQIAALQGVSLQIKDGDCYALLGPNAAGKSTLIGIVTSLIKKTSGQVRVYGHDLDLQKSHAKLTIGLVPQEFNLNSTEKPMSILVKQAGYYGIEANIARRRSEYYLQHFSLWEKRDQEVRHLSGGQKRRLLLARALIHEPKLLILDEPTSGVDVETRRFIWQFLKDLNDKGTTIILTTHYLEEAEQLCKNISIIDGGKIIANYEMQHLTQSMQMETIVLHLEKPLDSPFAFKNFASRCVNPTTLEVYVDKDQTINDLFGEVLNQSLNVISFQNKTNKLEELFLNLTSKSRGG